MFMKLNICFLRDSYPWLCSERRLWGMFPLGLLESDGGKGGKGAEGLIIWRWKSK